jgi:hypothetical protein
VDVAGIAVGSAVSVLALARLGSQPLRLDEARTALVADGVLATGAPRARSHGPTLFGPSEMAPNGLCVLHTPLQFYLGALGRLLGKGPGATRLPFALVGAAGAWGAIALGDHLVPGSGVYVGLGFLQVPALLLIRQARYYPLVLSARVFALWSLVLERWWIAAIAGLVIASAEWSGYLATLAASFVGAILGSWPLTEAVGLTSGLAVLLVWAWLRRGVELPVPLHRHPVEGFLEAFWLYFWKLQCYLAPVVTVAVVAAVVRAPIRANLVAGLTWIVLAHIGLRSVTSTVFTRYLTAALAPAAVAIGLVLAAIAERSLPLAVALSVLYVATNVLHEGPLLVLPPRAVRVLAFVRCPGGSHLTREAPEDRERRIRLPMLDFVRELLRPPRLRADGVARALPPAAVVLVGQTEAPTLQAAGPSLRVVPWGIDKRAEAEWLAEHPPDYVVAGDLDRPEAAVAGLPWSFRRCVLPVPDVLIANGETLERHVFEDRRLPVGVEILERCSS